MYTPAQLALRYIRYYCTASNGKGHGVHSPFVFELITRVLNDDRDFYMYQPIENLREELLVRTTEITIEDFGAGSRVKKSPVRKISAIAASSLKPRKFGQLLFRLVNHLLPQTILELGTSLGITTSYLAAANSNARVITMEGSAAVADIARSNFMKLGLHNIALITGNFDHTLEPTLAQVQQIDFAFLDGNHRYEPTIRYFNHVMNKAHANTVIILDDIHWSSEMEQAWGEVKRDKRVRLTIDLFYIGLVFLRSEQQEKEDFIIRF
ncbi:MAG TPA: class I SAM-dependent methyltransferase [Sediminibacterium sp.]|nr:class I SAM-dependent methyltransferase [Sediminibacterium sp.]